MVVCIKIEASNYKIINYNSEDFVYELDPDNLKLNIKGNNFKNPPSIFVGLINGQPELIMGEEKKYLCMVDVVQFKDF